MITFPVRIIAPKQHDQGHTLQIYCLNVLHLNAIHLMAFTMIAIATLVSSLMIEGCIVYEVFTKDCLEQIELLCDGASNIGITQKIVCSFTPTFWTVKAL